MKKVMVQLTEEQVAALQDALRWYRSALGDQWLHHQEADPRALASKLNLARARIREGLTRHLTP